MRDAISCRMVVLSRRDLCSRSLLCQMNYFLPCILLPQSVPEAPRVSQEAPRISQGAPWSPLGSPGLPPFKLQAQCLPFLCTKLSLLEHATGRHRTPRETAKWCQELRLGAHLPHAPGARMTVVTQTPSNYILYYIVTRYVHTKGYICLPTSVLLVILGMDLPTHFCKYVVSDNAI